MLQPRAPGSSSRQRSSRRVTQEKPEDIVRKLQRLPSNKKCADCSTKLPQVVNLTHGTFVCMACSGVHREFSHRVKGIGHSSFTPEEVAKLQEASSGNEAVNARFMAGYDPHRDRPRAPENNTDQQLLRVWIRRKYIDKAWHRSSESEHGTSQKQAGSKATRVAIPPAKKKTTPRSVPAPAPAADSVDLFSFDSVPAPTPAPQQNFSNSKTNDEWDAFGTQPTKQFVANFDQTQNAVPQQQPQFTANFDHAPNSDEVQTQGGAQFAQFEADFDQLVQQPAQPQVLGDNTAQSFQQQQFPQVGSLSSTGVQAGFNQPPPMQNMMQQISQPRNHCQGATSSNGPQQNQMVGSNSIHWPVVPQNQQQTGSSQAMSAASQGSDQNAGQQQQQTSSKQQSSANYQVRITQNNVQQEEQVGTIQNSVDGQQDQQKSAVQAESGASTAPPSVMSRMGTSNVKNAFDAFDAFDELTLGGTTSRIAETAPPAEESAPPSSIGEKEKTGDTGKPHSPGPDPFYKGQEAMYKSNNDIMRITVLSVDRDDDLVPHYTVRLPDGSEKQTDDTHLSKIGAEREADTSSTGSVLPNPAISNQNDMGSIAVTSQKQIWVDPQQHQIVSMMQKLNPQQMLQLQQYIENLLSSPPQQPHQNGQQPPAPFAENSSSCRLNMEASPSGAAPLPITAPAPAAPSQVIPAPSLSGSNVPTLPSPPKQKEGNPFDKF